MSDLNREESVPEQEVNTPLEQREEVKSET